MKWLLLFVVSLSACSCAANESPVSPIRITTEPKLIEVTPPPVYHTWWRQMEMCTKRRGDIRKWRFIMVQNPDPAKGFHIEGVKETQFAGYADTWSNVLYVEQVDIFNFDVVAHEMIHALGFIGHPKQVFDDCDVPA